PCSPVLCGVLRRRARVAGPEEGELARGSPGKCGQKPVKSLFPAEPTEKQNKRPVRDNCCNVGGNFAFRARRFVNSIGQDGEAREMPCEALKLRRFELRRHMDGRGVLHIGSLDTTDPRTLGKTAAARDQVLD